MLGAFVPECGPLRQPPWERCGAPQQSINVDDNSIMPRVNLCAVALLAIIGNLFLGAASRAQESGDIVRLGPAADAIIPADAQVEKVADGFQFVEGPIWIHANGAGYLLFSDIPANVIRKWDPKTGLSVFLEKSGFTGSDASDVGGQSNNGHGMVNLIGSNGITLDRQGRLTFCQHGDRQVVRLEKDGSRTVLASRYEGKRLNSPNDLVYKSDGTLYFTDPPAGLRQQDKDPKKELPFDGVYQLTKGKLTLLAKDFARPNGIALSPDEKYLYVNDTTKKIIVRYEVQPNDGVANGKVITDMTSDPAPGAPDGMKVDRKGNIYCTGPGGFWIMSPQGKHIATVRVKELVANMNWGDADGKTLYLTARTSLYRIRLNIQGVRP
jgi:gluconolactonase